MNPSDEKAVEEGCYFDETDPKRVREFFLRFLRHSKGEWAGQPFSLLDWQYESLIKPLFGWKQKDGRRRFRFCYCECGKKQGKSTLCSGLALYLLMADNEDGAEVYCCASDVDQARVVFGEAANMVAASPLIDNRVEVIHSKNRIVFPKTKSFFRVLSSKPKKSGINASAIIYDELHEADKRDLWDALRYAGDSRRQPLTISITNAGYDRETICWEQHRYAQKVLSGEHIDTQFLPLLFCAADEDDWTLEQTWKKANPSYGITIDAEEFRKEFEEAVNEPRKENNFRRFKLAQWVGTNAQWLSSKAWKDCYADKFDFSTLKGKPCFIGIDLARKYDLAAVVYLIPDGDLFYVIPRFFIPKDNAHKKEALDHVPYLLWSRHNWVTLTEGDTIDYRVIRQTILADVRANDWRVVEIGYDPYNAESLCRAELGDEDGFTVVVTPQTMGKIGPATAYLEKLIKDKKIRHDGNECLNWCAQNVVVKDQDGDIMPAKGKSTGRIDGITALINGLSRAMVAEIEPEESIYNSRGILAI